MQTKVWTLITAFLWLLVTFEMQKHKNFLEKHYTDVHTIIEQKP